MALEGKRKTIRLGKVAKRQAEAIKVHVEQLAHAIGTNTVPPLATSQWLASFDSKLYGKLVAVGLADEQSRNEPGRMMTVLELRVDQALFDVVAELRTLGGKNDAPLAVIRLPLSKRHDVDQYSAAGMVGSCTTFQSC
ncbi:MAG: hypothetical protein JNL18_24855 [Planctomycetaceae bacterium]|uniref:hypothetical protein n=1 Tax=Lacipirellula limnantheis TaxID=2528024 RepID=UPI0011A6F7FE|nr:hypothetical protein [Lacipirellula limnantheis]MBL9165975.1 hypothetical protein [Planctomycetaceae bacterium]